MSSEERFSSTEKFFIVLIIAFVFGAWTMLAYVQEYLVKVPDLYKEEFERAHKANGFEWPKFTDFWISIVASGFVCVAWHINYALFRGQVYKLIKEQKDKDL